MDLRRGIAPPSVRICPKRDQRSSGIEDLCFSVCQPGEHQGSNGLTALVDLGRPVGALGVKGYAQQKAERLAALVDLCRSLRPRTVMDSGQIGGVEDLCCTVHFLSVAHQMARRRAALVDLCCSPGALGVMEGGQIGGIEGLRCTVRFLSALDEFRDVPSP